jgi:spore protease
LNFRTDLALERHEILGGRVDGVNITEKENEECKTTIIEILSQESAQKLDKGVGKYITIEMNDFANESAASVGRLKAIKEGLSSLLPASNGTVLVVGIGNADMTADALGPNVASKIFATRHIGEELKDSIGLDCQLRPVASVYSGVLGQTGIETGEYVKSICDAIKPCCVITIDALAAGSVARLGKTVQMSDTGIAPGSGIGNTRKRIDEEYIGVPVIAVGVPTVVDAVALAKELCGVNVEDLSEEKINKTGSFIVAPKDIDFLVKNASYLLALAINCALQPGLSAEELYALM